MAAGRQRDEGRKEQEPPHEPEEGGRGQGQGWLPKSNHIVPAHVEKCGHLLLICLSSSSSYYPYPRPAPPSCPLFSAAASSPDNVVAQ
jgi:hypothetical protein